jgi:hypothetical protein
VKRGDVPETTSQITNSRPQHRIRQIIRAPTDHLPLQIPPIHTPGAEPNGLTCAWGRGDGSGVSGACDDVEVVECLESVKGVRFCAADSGGNGLYEFGDEFRL